jgi:outer membrane protein OmpA-like peptidoglycan-associated protein
MWWSLSALAQDLTFDAVLRVEQGRGQPSVTFRSQVEGKVSVQLACGSRRYARTEALHPGGSFLLELGGLPGEETSCAGSVRLDKPGGDWAETPLSFQVAVLQTLTLEASSLSLQDRRLEIWASRPLVRAEVELVSLGGVVLARETAVLADPQRPYFTWTADGEVLELVVTGADRSGYESRLELSPWSYAVPHEDVIFPSGQAEIPPSETAKLERCWVEVQHVIEKYGAVVDMELFVAGYTDTVGSPASNQSLSERRAAAIASWFAQRGFTGPVWYQGFGESALARPTPDETDDPANRRALYLLAAQAPPASAELPRSEWRRLP